MALNKKELESFRIELQRAAIDLKSDELKYYTQWWYLLPEHGLFIGETALHLEYNIPIGWNGFGEDDLDELEKRGFLKKISETEQDPVDFEKEIIYRIVKN
ncbi:hypothetical protein OAT16_07545 [Prolixibacteraceae bacterium]|nr:hypothetical protein [Prolixibacteraceae bacterium]